MKTVLIVAGPTAVGKTCVAIDLAKHFNTEIISADSRQCYRELKIGVARPSETELKEIPHHFIASHSVHDEVNAAVFEQFALKKTAELFSQHDIVIMAGGTGLYIKAFAEGLDEIPEVPDEVRTAITTAYAEHGIEWLQQKVAEADPVFYESGEIQNPQRLMRALEVRMATGESILAFRKGSKAKRPFNIIRAGLELSKQDLHRNIEGRVDKMVQTGLVEEAERLQSLRQLKALNTVGYSEIFEYLDGKMTLEQAKEEIRKNTRQYAKRQMTWFRKDKEMKWFAPTDMQALLSWVKTSATGDKIS